MADKAGNVRKVELTLPDGVPTRADLAGSGGAFGNSAPSPITPISSGPIFPDDPAEMPRAAEANPFPPRPAPAPSRWPGPSGDDRSVAGGAPDPFGPPSQAGAGEPWPPPPAPSAGASAQSGPGEPMLVPNPRFGLQYAVDDAGPGGPAHVEIWATRDGGRNWGRLAEDPDRVSPCPIDLSRLGGDGTYGLSLVARSASGLGDPVPVSGDPPQTWVEVDATPPVVQIRQVHVGSGAHIGKVALEWQASDPHLAPRPVVVSYRPDEPGAQWKPISQRIDNTGQFVWEVPPDVPARFHLRVDVVDSLGHRSFAETTPNGPIVVDRARPRGRIIGLDPNLRGGPSAHPLR